jgi:hypothetical protein
LLRTLGLENTENLVAGNESHLGDAVRVTEGDTDLGGRQALACEFDDMVNDVFWGGLEPGRRCPAVWKGRGR